MRVPKTLSDSACPSKLLSAALGSNFALLRAPGFEYELALAFLRRDRPGSKEPPLRGDEKRTGVRMKTGS